MTFGLPPSGFSSTLNFAAGMVGREAERDQMTPPERPRRMGTGMKDDCCQSMDYIKGSGPNHSALMNWRNIRPVIWPSDWASKKQGSILLHFGCLSLFGEGRLESEPWVSHMLNVCPATKPHSGQGFSVQVWLLEIVVNFIFKFRYVFSYTIYKYLSFWTKV